MRPLSNLVLSPLFRPLLYSLTCRWARPTALSPPSRVEVDPTVKQAVRELLRHGGHKPSGRGRPASESLGKALDEGRFPTIDPLVDFFNLQSLESGFPISVVDAAKLSPPLEFAIGRAGQEYQFNPSGQVLSLKGLLHLSDREGPTASPVKDAQRTKVDAQTQRFLVVVWGTDAARSSLDLLDMRINEWVRLQGLELEPLPPVKSFDPTV